MIELTFVMPPDELKPNKRFHYQAKARAVKAYRQAAWLVGRQAISESLKDGTYLGRWPLEAPVETHITFVFNMKRNRDGDNLLASLKALFDGLVDAKVLAADDSQSLHHAPVRVVVDKALKVPEVRIILESIYETGSKR